MIVFVTGENDYARRMSAAGVFEGAVFQRIDGGDLSYAQVIDMISGVSLFAEPTRVIIEGLSANKELWTRLPDILARHNEENIVVFSEAKPDKRTLAYKALVARARHIDHAPLGDRDGRMLEAWLIEEAKGLGATLTASSARLLVERVGYDQWALIRALEVLALADEINEQTIVDLTDQSLGANVFELLRAAVEGDVQAVQRSVATLREGDDAYRTFALLASQTVQLAGFVFAGKSDTPAKDLGVHPYVAGKLSRQAESVSQTRMRGIIQSLEDADRRMKRMSVEPWFSIEQALLQIATAR